MTLTEPATRYRILQSAQGRQSLWPATKPIPPGWREVHGASSKEECLAFVAAERESVPRHRAGSAVGDSRALDGLSAQPAGVQFSLMFFGGDEGKAAQDKYR